MMTITTDRLATFEGFSVVPQTLRDGGSELHIRPLQLQLRLLMLPAGTCLSQVPR